MPGSRTREGAIEGRVWDGKNQELQGSLAGKELRIYPEGSGNPWLNLKRGVELLELHFNEVG